MRRTILGGCLLARASAQSVNILSVLESEAYSLFTSATAVLEVRSTGESAATTSSTSGDQNLSSATETSTSLTRHPSTSSRTTLSTSSRTLQTTLRTSSSSTNVLAASSSTPIPSASNSNSHDRTLAIALGTVFGALALGLFILLMLVIFRYRRRNQGAGSPKGYVSAASEEVLETGKTMPSNVRQASVFHPSRRLKSLYRQGDAGPPLMSEHQSYDVLAPHQIRDDNYAPIAPGYGKNSLIRSGSGRFYMGKSGHHDPVRGGEASKSLLAAGHARNDSQSKANVQSDVVEIHPAFRNEAPTQSFSRSASQNKAPIQSVSRSTSRNEVPPPSMSHSASRSEAPIQSVNRSAFRSEAPTQSLSRSASKIEKPPRTVRINFYTSENDMRSTVRNKSTTGSIDASVAAAMSKGKQSDAAYGRGFGIPPSDAGHSGVHEISAMPTPPTGRSNVDPLDENTYVAADGPIITRSNSKMDGRVRPHARTQQPLPPAISIPSPSSPRRRPSLPGRSPKRARFSNTHTYHEPSPLYGQNFDSRENISSTDQTSSVRYPSSIESLGTVEFVSPISPEGGNGGYRRNMPVATGRANIVDVPRTRETNYNPPSDQTPISPELNEPLPQRFYNTIQNDSRQSGPVSASGGRFYQSQNQAQTSPQRSRKPAFPHFVKTTLNNAKAITRKPVPQPAYNRITANPSVDLSDHTNTGQQHGDAYQGSNMYNNNDNNNNNSSNNAPRKSGEYPSWPERYDGSDNVGQAR